LTLATYILKNCKVLSKPQGPWGGSDLFP